MMKDLGVGFGRLSFQIGIMSTKMSIIGWACSNCCCSFALGLPSVCARLGLRVFAEWKKSNIPTSLQEQQARL